MANPENERHQGAKNIETTSSVENQEQGVAHTPTPEELQQTVVETTVKLDSTEAQKTDTETQLAEVRSNLGLPHNNEIPHSIQAADERIETLTEQRDHVQNAIIASQDKEAREPEPYSAEADRKEISHKAKKIRSWAAEQGWKEGDDFLVIEDLSGAVPEGEKLSRHETKQFAVAIKQDHYKAFKDYILGRYASERQGESSKNQLRLNYSWGGRFQVGWEGVPFDTVPVVSMQTGAKTHHAEFKQFFKDKTGLRFPEASHLNSILRAISEKGLNTYIQQKEKLERLRKEGKAGTLPDHGDGLLSGLDHTINILRNAASGDAVKELPELVQQMPQELRWYADLTYNAEDIKDYSKLAEVTGIPLPDDIRIDKIYDQLGFDRQKMEDVCREFSEKLFI